MDGVTSILREVTSLPVNIIPIILPVKSTVFEITAVPTGGALASLGHGGPDLPLQGGVVKEEDERGVGDGVSRPAEEEELVVADGHDAVAAHADREDGAVHEVAVLRRRMEMDTF